MRTIDEILAYCLEELDKLPKERQKQIIDAAEAVPDPDINKPADQLLATILSSCVNIQAFLSTVED